MKQRFSTGQTVMTRAVADEIAENAQFAMEIADAYSKYINCNWGETSPEDAVMNDSAVTNDNDRIFAVYQTCKGKVWIITEWDRSVTTILFPSDY